MRRGGFFFAERNNRCLTKLINNNEMLQIYSFNTQVYLNSKIWSLESSGKVIIYIISLFYINITHLMNYIKCTFIFLKSINRIRYFYQCILFQNSGPRQDLRIVGPSRKFPRQHYWGAIDAFTPWPCVKNFKPRVICERNYIRTILSHVFVC